MRDHHGNTLLHYVAAKSHHPELIHLLVAEGYNPKAINSAMIRMLVKHGCPLEDANYDQYTPLQSAVVANKKERASTLLACGADKEVTDRDGNTLLHLATSKKMITMLVNTGFPCDEVNYDGQTPLQKAVISGDIMSAQALIEHGVNKDVTDRKRNTLLHLTKNPAMVIMLIETGCNLTTKNNKQNTPFFQAFKNDNRNIQELFIARSVDVIDDLGNTLLHDAVRKGYSSLVNRLITRGYNINAENHSDDTPLELAVSYRHKEIEMQLRRLGAGTNGVSVPADMTIREFRRKMKQDIILQGAVSPLPENRTPTVPQVIESCLYLGNEASRLLFKGKAAETNKLPLMQPLMQAMALAGLGKHDEGQDYPAKHKRFKIIGVDAPSVAALRVTSTALGEYSLKNSGVVAMGKRDKAVIWGVILHESAHFVMKEVYKNDCNPYLKEDDTNKKRMGDVLEATKKRMSALDEEGRAKRSIADVFLSYRATEHASELIVRVPEIIAKLGNERGSAWLTYHVPELMDFYETQVNPAINRYLEVHQVHQHLVTFCHEEKKTLKRKSSGDIIASSLLPSDSMARKRLHTDPHAMSAMSFVERVETTRRLASPQRSHY